jgi:CBS domain-containing protein
VQVRPPLGVLRDFVADDDAYPGTIDLKKFGARPFVDAARIFALQNGIGATNTAERIRLTASRLRMSDDEAAAIVDGFHFVQLLRLRTQAESGTTPNRINPENVNELDRRILKEALRQARKLQNRLELDFRL